MAPSKRTEFIVGHFSGLLALMDMLHKSGLLSEAEVAEVLKDSYSVAADLLQVFQLADSIAAGIDADIHEQKALPEAKLRDLLVAFRGRIERLSERVCGELVVGEIKTHVDEKLAEFKKARRSHLKVLNGGNKENAS